MVKRKRGEDDPRDFPASSYDKGLFQINMPFVQLKKLNSAPNTVNKFFGGLMNPEVLQYIQKEVVDPAVQKVARTYVSSGELTARIALASLAPAVKDLVFSEVEDVEISRKKRKKDGDESDSDVEATEEETPQDAAIDPCDSNTSPGSARDMAACHEERRTMRNNQGADIVMEVIDKEIEADESYSLEDARCAALVIDGKGRHLKKDWVPSDSWQVKAYTYYHTRENVEKGRFSPVSFACVSEDEWGSGVLEPHGLVRLEAGGVLTAEGLKEARKFQERVWKKKFGTDVIPEGEQITRAYIEEQIKTATQRLRQEYSNDASKSATLLPGLYLIATAYTSQKVYPTRKYPLIKGEPPALAAYTFLEGVLRSVLGERMLKLAKVDHVKEIVSKNAARLQQEIDNSYLTHDAAKVSAAYSKSGGEFV